MKGNEQRGRGYKAPSSSMAAVPAGEDAQRSGGAVAEKPACLQQGGDKNLRGAGRQRPGVLETSEPRS